jgi:hypothetical protein
MSMLGSRMDAMAATNNLLEDQIDIIDPSLITEFFVKQVQFYEVDFNGLTDNYELLNTFEAIKAIQNICLRQLKKPKPPIPSRNLEFEFIIKNNFGTLLEECERTIDLSKNHLELQVEDFTHTMTILLTLGLLFLALFFISSIVLVKIMNSSTSHFSSVFSRLSEDEVLEIKSGLENFLQKLMLGLDSRPANTGSNNFSSRLKNFKALEKKAAAKKKLVIKNFDLYSSYVSNLITAINTWPNLVIVMIFMLVIHITANSESTNMSKYQDQLIVPSHYMYYSNIGFVGLIDLITMNGTTKIKGKPISSELNLVYKFGGNNEDFLESFKNSEGTYELEQYSLLFDISCDDQTVVAPELRNLCVELSGQTKRIGIVVMNSVYEKTLVDLKSAWESSDRSLISVSEFLHRHYEYVTPVIELQEALIQTLTDKTEETLRNYLEDEEKKVNRLLIVQLIVSGGLLWASVRWLLERNLKKEDEYKRWLSLVPTAMLMVNRYLRSYLILTSGKVGDILKKITK